MASPFGEWFTRLVGREPAPHQRACAGALANGRSIVLRAPTGSGKSEAIWIPYLLYRGTSLPSRMIHVLPMRALANQLTERMEGYGCKAHPSLRVAAMHGKRPESVLFWADAIFATLDQVVTSYACAPLSLSVRHGNIPAGAIASSLLVFDEVHTFEPRLGLQASLVLARRAVEFGLPVVVSSATLPTNFVKALASVLEAEVVEAGEFQGRPKRSVVLELRRSSLDADDVLERARCCPKTLVVVNTVGRAMAIYEGVRDRFEGITILAHSRFYDEDRAAKERLIVEHFGKNASPQPALLVATQVVEVGLDISCELLLTELAPADALIQRAGRCARWGGEGRVVIFTELETHRPYDAHIMEATRRALQEYGLDAQLLSWQLETSLVDQVLGPCFEGITDPRAAGRVLASLAEANFTGNPAKAEKAVRESLSIEVAVHDNPSGLGVKVLGLPRCRLHPWTFQRFLEQHRPQAWQVSIDRKIPDDYSPQVRLDAVARGARLVPGGFYVVHPDLAAYDAEFGLRLGAKGQAASPSVEPLSRKPAERPGGLETWEEHANRTVEAFEQVLLPKEKAVLPALAKLTGQTPAELLAWFKLVLVLHDVGKLTERWQTLIREGLEPPPPLLLARRGGTRPTGLPPHATVSAWLATPLLMRLAGSPRIERLAVPSLAAIAHHHCVRAEDVPAFQMADGWFEPVKTGIERLTGHRIAENDFNTKSPIGSGSLNLGLSFLSARAYTVYLVLSRWLRLSDWMASGGGESAVLRFEEWFRDT